MPAAAYKQVAEDLVSAASQVFQNQVLLNVFFFFCSLT